MENKIVECTNNSWRRVMYKIAICDDEQGTCNEIEQYILEYCKRNFIRSEVVIFYSGEMLCEYLKTKAHIELLFLDIELPNVNGVHVGQFIRETLRNEQMEIVYISSKQNYAMELFQNRPLDFIVKPVTFENAKRVLDIFVRKSGVKSKIFECMVNKVYTRIPYGNICYLKSNDKKISVVTIDGQTIEFYGKLKDITDELSDDMFIAIHKSYLINYEYVEKYTHEWVKMINGDVLNISKINRKAVKERLLELSSQ